MVLACNRGPLGCAPALRGAAAPLRGVSVDDVLDLLKRLPGVSESEERARKEIRAEAEKGAEAATRPGFLVVGAIAVAALVLVILK